MLQKVESVEDAEKSLNACSIILVSQSQKVDSVRLASPAPHSLNI